MGATRSFGMKWRKLYAWSGRYTLDESGPLSYGWDGEEGIYFDDEAAIRVMNAAPGLLAACKKARTCSSINSSVQALLVDAIKAAEGNG